MKIERLQKRCRFLKTVFWINRILIDVIAVLAVSILLSLLFKTYSVMALAQRLILVVVLAFSVSFFDLFSDEARDNYRDAKRQLQREIKRQNIDPFFFPKKKK